MKNEILKKKITSEYLESRCTYQELSSKYHIPLGTIYRWVKKYSKMTKAELQIYKSWQPEEDFGALPTDSQQLIKELKQEKLKNKLLNEIINVAEENLKINIRKKPGTKQS